VINQIIIKYSLHIQIFVAFDFYTNFDYSILFKK
jgi:hypothetical protein